MLKIELIDNGQLELSNGLPTLGFYPPYQDVESQDFYLIDNLYPYMPNPESNEGFDYNKFVFDNVMTPVCDYVSQYSCTINKNEFKTKLNNLKGLSEYQVYFLENVMENSDEVANIYTFDTEPETSQYSGFDAVRHTRVTGYTFGVVMERTNANGWADYSDADELEEEHLGFQRVINNYNKYGELNYSDTGTINSINYNGSDIPTTGEASKNIENYFYDSEEFILFGYGSKKLSNFLSQDMHAYYKKSFFGENFPHIWEQHPNTFKQGWSGTEINKELHHSTQPTPGAMTDNLSDWYDKISKVMDVSEQVYGSNKNIQMILDDAASSNELPNITITNFGSTYKTIDAYSEAKKDNNEIFLETPSSFKFQCNAGCESPYTADTKQLHNDNLYTEYSESYYRYLFGWIRCACDGKVFKLTQHIEKREVVENPSDADFPTGTDYNYNQEKVAKYFIVRQGALEKYDFENLITGAPYTSSPGAQDIFPKSTYQPYQSIIEYKTGIQNNQSLIGDGETYNVESPISVMQGDSENNYEDFDEVNFYGFGHPNFNIEQTLLQSFDPYKGINFSSNNTINLCSHLEFMYDPIVPTPDFWATDDYDDSAAGYNQSSNFGNGAYYNVTENLQNYLDSISPAISDFSDTIFSCDYKFDEPLYPLKEIIVVCNNGKRIKVADSGGTTVKWPISYSFPGYSGNQVCEYYSKNENNELYFSGNNDGRVGLGLYYYKDYYSVDKNININTDSEDFEPFEQTNFITNGDGFNIDISNYFRDMLGYDSFHPDGWGYFVRDGVNQTVSWSSNDPAYMIGNLESIPLQNLYYQDQSGENNFTEFNAFEQHDVLAETNVHANMGGSNGIYGFNCNNTQTDGSENESFLHYIGGTGGRQQMSDVTAILPNGTPRDHDSSTVGYYIKIGNEIMQITSIGYSPAENFDWWKFNVDRHLLGTTATCHNVGASVQYKDNLEDFTTAEVDINEYLYSGYHAYILPYTKHAQSTEYNINLSETGTSPNYTVTTPFVHWDFDAYGAEASRHAKKLEFARWIESDQCFSHQRCLQFSASANWSDTSALMESNNEGGSGITDGSVSDWSAYSFAQVNHNQYRTINQAFEISTNYISDLDSDTELEVSFYMLTKAAPKADANLMGPDNSGGLPMVETSIYTSGDSTLANIGGTTMPHVFYPIDDDNNPKVWPFPGQETYGGGGAQMNTDLFYSRGIFRSEGQYNSLHHTFDSINYTGEQGYSLKGTIGRFSNTGFNIWQKMSYTFKLSNYYKNPVTSTFLESQIIKNLTFVVQAFGEFEGIVLLDNFSVKESFDFTPDVHVINKLQNNIYSNKQLINYYDASQSDEKTQSPLKVGFYFYPRYNSNFIFTKTKDIQLEDFKIGKFYIYDIEWGDGEKDYQDEPRLIDYNTISYHYYKKSGIYKITGYILKLKTKIQNSKFDRNNIGIGKTKRFELYININEGTDEDFTYFNDDGFSFIPYKNTTPVVGGTSTQSQYYNTIKRQLGFLTNDVKVDITFENPGDKLKTELALLKMEKQNDSDLEVLPNYMIKRFDDENIQNDTTKIYNGISPIKEELGHGIGDADLTNIKYYNKPKSIWEMFGFEESDLDEIGNPNNPRYWKKIIPQDYSIYNREGLGGDYINSESQQDWLDGSYYPVLPKYNLNGKFGELKLDEDGNVPLGFYPNNKIPFPLEGDITDENESNQNLLINILSEKIGDNVLSDGSGNQNLGFSFSDYKPKFNTKTLKVENTKSTPTIKNSKSKGAF